VLRALAESELHERCAEIIDLIGASAGDPRLLLERTFNRWRWFWGATGGELSDTEAVGLFAELWFLERWTGPIGMAAIEKWTGPFRESPIDLAARSEPLRQEIMP
jgi:hypothetical protein